MAPALIKVKDKFQFTLPASLREEAKVAVGDLFEGSFENGKIVLSAKSLIDRSIEEGREAIREGRSKSFDNAEDLIEDLHAAVRRRKRR